MIRPDYRDSRAVLIGAWSYRDARLPEVPAARNSLQRMRALLTSDICSWPADRVLTLSDPQSPADLPDQLMRWFGEAHDVALFYFVGHGQLDDDLQLCLCLGGSVTSEYRLSTTSLMYDSVRRALQRSPAQVKIVILDCCYSGMAANPHALSGSSTDLATLALANGVYIMAASGPHGLAYSQTPDDDPHPMTYFTRTFADVLHEGISGQPEFLRLNSIFLEVHSRLVAAAKPAPTKRAANTADEFVFARNLVAPAQQRDHERENLELRDQLSAIQTELASARLERQQLHDQLKVMHRRLDEPRRADEQEVRRDTERLADELRQADSKVQETEKHLHDLSRFAPPPPRRRRRLDASQRVWRTAGVVLAVALTVALGFAVSARIKDFRDKDKSTGSPYTGVGTVDKERTLAFSATRLDVVDSREKADLIVEDSAATGGTRQLWFISPAAKVDAKMRDAKECAEPVSRAERSAKGHYVAVGKEAASVCVRPRVGGHALVHVTPHDITIDWGSFDLFYGYAP